MGKAMDYVDMTSGKQLKKKNCNAYSRGALYLYWGHGKRSEIERHQKPAKEIFKLWKTTKIDQIKAWDKMDPKTKRTKQRIVVEYFDDVCDHYDVNGWSDPISFIAECVINGIPCHLMIGDENRASGVYHAIVNTIGEWAENERLVEEV